MSVFRYIFKTIITSSLIAILFLGPSVECLAATNTKQSGITEKQGGTSFSVSEGGPGALAALPQGFPGMLVIQCPPGVGFSQLPKVSVSGDLKLDLACIYLNIPLNDKLVIPVKQSSTIASTIYFEQVVFTLNRTVPEGDIVLQAGGSALDWSNAGIGMTIQIPSGNLHLLKVVTPAPDEQNCTALFTVDASTFILNGEETTMDVPAYTKDGRTFIPLHYAAQALGISDTGIIWDKERLTATLMKGEKLVQVQIGSRTMFINGMAVTLDVAPEITGGRTCLPVGLLAQALGENATWDAESNTVEIKPV